MALLSETLASLSLESRIWRSKSDAPIKKLGILLHGYGANKDDLIGLAEQLTPSDQREDWLWVSPDAPETIPGGWTGGRQWFGLATLSPDELRVGAKAARPILIAYLQDLLTKLDLSVDTMSLVGFSQGCMMALEAGLNLPEAPAAIVGFSGAYVSAGDSSLAKTNKKPPILMVHGDLDPVVPYGALSSSKQALDHLGFDVKTYTAQGLGHSIDAGGVQMAARFLQTHN